MGHHQESRLLRRRRIPGATAERTGYYADCAAAVSRCLSPVLSFHVVELCFVLFVCLFLFFTSCVHVSCRIPSKSGCTIGL
ncbi:hypothetical protein RvY_03269 [Ramazzottius varieornatus]|uniref:Uncharacterized protein n=1 Tax=Ramazzottius varieornatus TaxID=947166 RepID=A0A1D1UXP2_RAMVA|nr:hypothetical protein RvY_03269 [Ramazzottius varieornatus]